MRSGRQGSDPEGCAPRAVTGVLGHLSTWGCPAAPCCQCHGGDDATGSARAGQGLWGQGQLPVAPTASSELQGCPPGAASKVCLAGHVSCLCDYPRNGRTKRLLNAEVFFSVSSFSGRGEMAQGSGDWGQS